MLMNVHNIQEPKNFGPKSQSLIPTYAYPMHVLTNWSD